MAISSISRGTTVTTANTTWANTSNLFDGTAGTASNTYATFTNGSTSGSGNSTGSITVSGYDFSGIDAGSTVNAVYARVRWYVDQAAKWQNYFFQAYLGNTPLGTQVSDNLLNTTAAETSLILTGVSITQLLDPTFGIRFAITHDSANANTMFIDYVDAYIDYSASSRWGSLYL
jgi:hypothetical protein